MNQETKLEVLKLAVQYAGVILASKGLSTDDLAAIRETSLKGSKASKNALLVEYHFHRFAELLEAADK